MNLKPLFLRVSRLFADFSVHAPSVIFAVPLFESPFNNSENSCHIASQAGGGRALVFEVEYHPRKKKKKKNHVIRVVFQDQPMYARISFRGAKTCKIRGKCVFLVILTNFANDMTDKLRKTHEKRVSRVFFHT